MSRHDKKRASQGDIPAVTSQKETRSNVTSVPSTSREAIPILRRRRPLSTSFVSVPTSCTKNGDARTAMRRKTGCMLKRRSWVQFSGEQELDSAGTLEQAC